MRSAFELGRRKPVVSRQTAQTIGFWGIRLISLATVLPILGIVVYIAVKGGSIISWEFLTEMPYNGMRSGGILPANAGTFYLMVGTALFSIPLGITAGIYLAEYARDNVWTRLIRIAIISLAGVPSVVYGLFGLGLFVLFFGFPFWDFNLEPFEPGHERVIGHGQGMGGAGNFHEPRFAPATANVVFADYHAAHLTGFTSKGDSDPGRWNLLPQR